MRMPAAIDPSSGQIQVNPLRSPSSLKRSSPFSRLGSTTHRFNRVVLSATNSSDHGSLFIPLQSSPEQQRAKVTVVGVGNVGMACAQTILTQELAEELALIDVNPDKLRGEMLDLQHAAAFLQRATISASTDYAASAGSDVCIITAGARQREGETRLDLTARNAALYCNIVPELVRHSPGAVLLVVSNPVDVLAWATWQLAGSVLPATRVIGSGTNLDTARLRFLLAEQMGANARDVQAYVLGEHGDSSVPVWSTVSVAGRILREEWGPSSSAELEELHRGVVESAYEVIRLKGYTSWAIGYSTASIVRNILRDQRRICPVSVMAKGFYGIEEEVFLSLPVQLGRNGVVSVVNAPLSEEEAAKLRGSAKTLWNVQQQLKLLD
ncbi:L-lactate dehydrogenase B [Selaginella moellendorffii]|nr:L-lactate dehydrogenase B [Selaginella moellendorffii]|eukprot:XP_002988827.2 L-lactate dehydrogenase B [Selaginella moellendorffii]